MFCCGGGFCLCVCVYVCVCVSVQFSAKVCVFVCLSVCLVSGLRVLCCRENKYENTNLGTCEHDGFHAW